MSSLKFTAICILTLSGLQVIITTSRQFILYEMDRNADHWQRIQQMPCTHKPFKDDFQGIMSCILQSIYDKESFMVGTNVSHCILCYYQVNGTTLNASEFQGNFLFRRGKQESMTTK